MKCDRQLLPLKAHFFIFWGSISSVLPFMMVVARQLGVPVGTQGIISAAVIAAAVLAKPVISAAADYFPALRKSLFLGLLTVMVLAIGPIGFLPPLYDPPVLWGSLLEEGTGVRRLLTPSLTDRCYVQEAWDCVATCTQPEACPLGVLPARDLRLSTAAHWQDSPDPHLPALTEDTEDLVSVNSILQKDSRKDYYQIYLVEGLSTPDDANSYNVSLECRGGWWSGPGCVAPWRLANFWVYVILLLLGQVAATTVESISDAVCCDTIGEDGDYGSQRAWGALSYGVLGVVSGLLVDWWSMGASTTKNYTPAFFLMVGFGTLDVLLSATCLKVPRLKEGSDVWKNLRPLLFHPHVLVFLALAFFIGFFDGLDTGYVFVLQEDMARGSSVMRHMKLLQGLTMLVQAISSVPFMFLCDWFVKRLGSQRVITLVLLLYAVRLLGLALASYLGLVWATVAIEVINGPCFGLGFTAMIVHAANITPPGTSTTVQSVVSVCYGTLGYAGASFLGGLVYEGVGGELLYLYTGVLAALTCLLHLAYLRCFPDTGRTEVELENGVPEEDFKVKVDLQSVREMRPTDEDKWGEKDQRGGKGEEEEEEEEEEEGARGEEEEEEERLLMETNWKKDNRECMEKKKKEENKEEVEEEESLV